MYSLFVVFLFLQILEFERVGGLSSLQGTLLISNVNLDNVHFVDLESLAIVANVSVGEAPHALATNQDIACVANYESTDPSIISVIDVRTREVIRNITTGPDDMLHGIVFKDYNHIIVTAENRNAMYLIDVNTGLIREIYDVSPLRCHVVTVDFNSPYAYCSDMWTGRIGVVDLYQHTFVTFYTPGGSPSDVTFTPDRKEVWVPDQIEDVIYILDANTTQIIDVLKYHGAIDPRRVAMLGLDRAIITNQVSGDISIVNTKTREELLRLPLPVPPDGNPASPLVVTVLPGEQYAVIGEQGNGKIWFLDLGSFEWVANVDGFDRPESIEYIFPP